MKRTFVACIVMLASAGCAGFDPLAAAGDVRLSPAAAAHAAAAIDNLKDRSVPLSEPYLNTRYWLDPAKGPCCE